MPQSYWHLTGNLWALALSTVIALFLPDFGPMERMDGGVGVVIRATMAVPLVFSFLYWTGRLIINLTDKLKKWWLMSIITAGIEQGIRDVAERRAKKILEERGEEMVRQRAEEIIQQRMAEEIYRQSATEEIARRVAQETAERVVEEISRRGVEETGGEKSAKDMVEAEREEVKKFMRSKGVSDEDIDAFFRRVSNQD